MTISVAARKAKGRELQKWVCKQISELLNIPWSNEDDALISSRPMGQSGPDVILRGEAKEKFRFSIECKRQESWSIPAWIKQAKSNRMKNTNWLLIARTSRQDPIIIMDAKAFFTILKNQPVQEKEFSFHRSK